MRLNRARLIREAAGLVALTKLWKQELRARKAVKWYYCNASIVLEL